MQTPADLERKVQTEKFTLIYHTDINDFLDELYEYFISPLHAIRSRHNLHIEGRLEGDFTFLTVPTEQLKIERPSSLYFEWIGQDANLEAGLDEWISRNPYPRDSPMWLYRIPDKIPKPLDGVPHDQLLTSSYETTPGGLIIVQNALKKYDFTLAQHPKSEANLWVPEIERIELRD